MPSLARNLPGRVATSWNGPNKLPREIDRRYISRPSCESLFAILSSFVLVHREYFRKLLRSCESRSSVEDLVCSSPTSAFLAHLQIPCGLPLPSALLRPALGRQQLIALRFQCSEHPRSCIRVVIRYSAPPLPWAQRQAPRRPGKMRSPLNLARATDGLFGNDHVIAHSGRKICGKRTQQTGTLSFLKRTTSSR